MQGADHLNRSTEADWFHLCPACAPFICVREGRPIGGVRNNHRRNERMYCLHHEQGVPPGAIQKRNIGEEHRAATGG